MHEQRYVMLIITVNMLRPLFPVFIIICPFLSHNFFKDIVVNYYG